MQRIHNGFYDERETLEDDLDEDLDFSFMENTDAGSKTDKGRKLDAFDYIHGLCYYFAQQLQKTFGYKIQAVYDEEGDAIHAFCVDTLDDGRTVYIDARGCTTDFEEFIEEYEDFVDADEAEPVDFVPKIKFTKAGIKGAENLINEYKEYYDTKFFNS